MNKPYKPYQEKNISYAMKKIIINEYTNNKSVRSISIKLNLSEYLIKCTLQDYFKKINKKILEQSLAKKRLTEIPEYKKNMIVDFYKKNDFCIEKTRKEFPEYTKIMIERIIINYVNNIPRQEGMTSFVSMITL